MAIELIDKIAPKNDGFTGMVDADQIIGDDDGGGHIPTDALDTLPDHDHSGDAGDGGQVAHSDLSGVGTDDHHDEAHTHAADSGGQLDWDVVWADAVHNHQSDAEGGKLDHGAALNGLTDDDHTQYLLATGARTGGSSQAQTFTNGIKTNTVAERSSGSGVTIDSVQLKDGEIAACTARGCRAIRTTTQSIPHGSWTALDFNSQVHDTDSGFGGTALSPDTKLYAKTAGYYIAGGGVTFASPGAVDRKQAIMIQKDGTTKLGLNDVYAGLNASTSVSVVTGMFYMAAGTYVEFLVFQDTGSSLNTQAATSTTQQKANGWLVRVA